MSSRKHLTILEYLENRVIDDAVEELERSVLEKDRMHDTLEEIAEQAMQESTWIGKSE